MTDGGVANSALLFGFHNWVMLDLSMSEVQPWGLRLQYLPHPIQKAGGFYPKVHHTRTERNSPVLCMRLQSSLFVTSHPKICFLFLCTTVNVLNEIRPRPKITFAFWDSPWWQMWNTFLIHFEGNAFVEMHCSKPSIPWLQKMALCDQLALQNLPCTHTSIVLCSCAHQTQTQRNVMKKLFQGQRGTFGQHNVKYQGCRPKWCK